MNIMEKKYQVFISSTYTDLQKERAAVTQTLLNMGCIPVGMEQFPASDMDQMSYIKMMLDDCDYYILILAGRYGSCDTDGVGFTEKEYDYAISKGIPVLSFLIENIEDLPQKYCESTEEGKEKLKAFRKKVSTGRLIQKYKDIGSLQSDVTTSLTRCIKDNPAIGWVRGNQIRSNITNYGDPVHISEIHNIYENKAMHGKFTFDYSNNNGEYTIGTGMYCFVTRWGKSSNKNIYAYGNKVSAIARVKGPVDFTSCLLGDLDFSSRVRTPDIGDVIIWKNENRKYAATKIIDIKDDTRGDNHDEVTCEYVIYHNINLGNPPF